MPLNVVVNNQPAQAVAHTVDTYTAEQNAPNPGQPPGSIGAQNQPFLSQLTKGNPGGVDAVSGIGVGVDTTG